MRTVPTLALLSCLALAACDKAPPPAENSVASDTMGNDMGNSVAASATAMNFTAGDGSALGSVTTADGAAGLILTLAGANMPAGVHGIHIHAVGKCEGPKFESAGSHWNPASTMHGKDNPKGAHKGDLPNITVGSDGVAKDVVTAAGVTMADLQDADGSALVVHAKPDDYKTDPSGASGDRIACAVIAPPR